MKIPFIKRYSTILNIIEAVGLVAVQFLISMPGEMSVALWIVLGLRVAMAVAQALKQSIRSDEDVIKD